MPTAPQGPARTRLPTLSGAVLLWVALLPTIASGTGAVVGRVELAIGPVERSRGDSSTWGPALPGTVLAAGDRVRTGSVGRVELRVAGATVRVFEGSVLEASPRSDPEQPGVTLERGTSLVDVAPGGVAPFRVETPEAHVRGSGARFGVSLGDGEAVIEVLRGSVGVRAPGSDARETVVREGFAAVGGRERPFELHPSSSLDAHRSGPRPGAVPAARAR